MVKGLSTLILSLALSALPAFTHASGMSRSQVIDVLEKLNLAKNNQNMDAINSLLAKSIKVTLDMPEDMGGKIQLNKRDYQAKIARTWRLPAEYHYGARDVNVIVIGTGERAIVTNSLIETLSLNGSQLGRTLLKQRMMVELKAGNPVITEIYTVLSP